MDPSSSARSRSRSPLRRGGRVTAARRGRGEFWEWGHVGCWWRPSIRSHVARLYLGNTMSAKDIVDLVRKAQKAEAKGVNDLARAGGPKNAQRDLMRMLLRGCILPALYWASVPVDRYRAFGSL